MEQQNLFENDWIDCLRAHYAHVIREQDTNNEQSLVSVLLETGFTGDDIEAMRSEVMTSLGGDEQTAEAEISILEEAEYDWVLLKEPVILTVEDTAYEWVLPQDELQLESSAEMISEGPAEVPEPVIMPEETQATVEIEPMAESDEDEEPPESFVQMSLF